MMLEAVFREKELVGSVALASPEFGCFTFRERVSHQDVVHWCLRILWMWQWLVARWPGLAHLGSVLLIWCVG